MLPDHVLDKFIIRDLFWFIVLPYRFKQWICENKSMIQKGKVSAS